MISFLTPYKYYAIGLAVASTLAFCALQQYRINSFKADIAQAKIEKMELTVLINKQNDAVNLMKIDSDKRVAIGLLAIKNARLISQARLNKVNALQEQLSNINMTCEESINVAKGGL